MKPLKTVLHEKQAFLRNFRYRNEIKTIHNHFQTTITRQPLAPIWVAFLRHHPYQTYPAIRYLKDTLPLLLETHCFDVDPYCKLLFQQRYWEQARQKISEREYQKLAAQLTKVLIVMRRYPVLDPDQLVTQFAKEKQEDSCFKNRR